MIADKLRQFDERVGAMSLRERVMVFAAVFVVAFALVQTLLIDRVNQRAQSAEARLQAAATALQAIEVLRGPQANLAARDPDQTAREALAAQEAQLARLNAELEARGRALVAPERMHAVLKDVVRGQGGVRIVGFKTLAPQPVSLAEGNEASLPGFYRHGFEVVVNGSYADLVAYLERLEALPWNLSWVEARLDAATRPDLKLTLIIHTLSLEATWLRV
jgi:MSHA biogenesis protein MshJ